MNKVHILNTLIYFSLFKALKLQGTNACGFVSVFLVITSFCDIL